MFLVLMSFDVHSCPISSYAKYHFNFQLGWGWIGSGGKA